MKKKETNALKISFHNPNTIEETAKLLIKLIAESFISKAIIENEILHKK